MNKSVIAIIASAILALGMVGMAFVIKAGMDNNTFRGRTISSRGVATKVVQSDMASGYIHIAVTGSEAVSAKDYLNGKCDSIKRFAISCNVPENAISVDPANIEIRHHYDNHGEITSTYYEAETYVKFFVKGENVLNLYKMESQRDKLIDMDVIISEASFDYSYSDDALTKIKPEMATEATKNARTSADQLAEDNNCHVGDIVSVSQGYLEVESIEGRPDYEKSVRVVNYAEFYLK